MNYMGKTVDIDKLFSRFSELTEQIKYIEEQATLSGVSTEEFAEQVRKLSISTGMSAVECAKMIGAYSLQGGMKPMLMNDAVLTGVATYIGNYKGVEVYEMSLADYVTLYNDNADVMNDVYIVITEDLNVIEHGWAVGRINKRRNNITMYASNSRVNVKNVYMREFAKRAPASYAQKVKESRETLISARPTVETLIKEGENRLEQQLRESQKLIESLRRTPDSVG